MGWFDDGVQNAFIRSTYLGREDHGIFVIQLNLEYDGGGQSFQRSIDKNDSAGLYQTIVSICDAVRVRSWEQLSGHYCRAKIESGLVRDIGNIVDDIWAFSPTQEEKDES